MAQGFGRPMQSSTMHSVFFKPLILLFRIYLLPCCVVELWLNILYLCFLSIIKVLVSVLPAIMNICRISRGGGGGNRGLCIAVEFFSKKTSNKTFHFQIKRMCMKKYTLKKHYV